MSEPLSDSALQRLDELALAQVAAGVHECPECGIRAEDVVALVEQVRYWHSVVKSMSEEPR